MLFTLEQVNTSDQSLRKKNLYEQNFDNDANLSGVVNFRCMQMSLVIGMCFFFFLAMIELHVMTRHKLFITFLLFGNDVISL